MSVNILRCRVTSERQPRLKNGQPAQSTTGVLRARIESSATHRSSSRLRRARHRDAPWPAGRPASVSDGADPEPPCHVTELGIRPPALRQHFFGSNAMPQIGQSPGLILLHLRMHRAGVDRARDSRRGRLVSAALRETRRVGVELLFAAGRAKVIGRARVRARTGSRVRLDLHAANRIGVCHHEFVRRCSG